MSFRRSVEVFDCLAEHFDRLDSIGSVAAIESAWKWADVICA